MEPERGVDGPRVSVIMPCRNGLPFLREALAGLRAQTFGAWELLFVDGGSTDGSVAAARAAIPSARILSAPDAPAPGVARNRAAAQARGSLLAFLDADDRWYPEKLERQVAFLASSGADLVYSDCRVVDRNGGELGLYLSRHRPARGRVREALLTGNFVPLSTLLVTRALFERSGGFAEGLQVADDYEWLLRAAGEGRVDFLPEPLADYRLTPGSVTEDFRAAYGENLEVFRELLRSESDAAMHRRLSAAESMVLWRWALREALEGPGGWTASLGLAARAMVAAPGPWKGLATLPRVLTDGLRGVGLRRRMLRARREPR